MDSQNGNLGINTLTGIGCRLLVERLKLSTSVSISPNVQIIAAVADLKAQMFHFKNKVYE